MNPPPTSANNPFAAVAALLVICLLSLFTRETHHNPAAQPLAGSTPAVELSGNVANHLTPIRPA